MKDATKELQELMLISTPEPWVADKAVCDDGTETFAIYHYPKPSHCIEVIETPDELGGECIHNGADAQLIVKMRNTLPALLERIELLEDLYQAVIKWGQIPEGSDDSMEAQAELLDAAAEVGWYDNMRDK